VCDMMMAATSAVLRVNECMERLFYTR